MENTNFLHAGLTPETTPGRKIHNYPLSFNIKAASLCPINMDGRILARIEVWWPLESAMLAGQGIVSSPKPFASACLGRVVQSQLLQERTLWQNLHGRCHDQEFDPQKSESPHVAYTVIEASHRPTRKREKVFGRCRSHRHAQRFLAAHDQINLIFRPRRYQLTATSYRHARNDACRLWTECTAEMAA